MKMEPLSLKTALDLVWWRNAARQTLRTPGWSTEGGQLEFHAKINKPKGDLWYWQFVDKSESVAVGGLELDQPNQVCEISLLVSPRHEKEGIGKQVAHILLNEAFYAFNMVRLYGEVYECGNVEFWERVFPKAEWAESPHLKYYHGHNRSKYFWIDREGLWE